MGKYTFYVVAVDNTKADNANFIEFINKEEIEILYLEDSDRIANKPVKDCVYAIRQFLIENNIIRKKSNSLISWFRKRYLINRFKD